ncbi:MAG: DUF362 domain-containing protein [Deltaproteobacteria bacterium]|nr:DUF362 domain-containing protein [Deltaproteobacteria bacterium]
MTKKKSVVYFTDLRATSKRNLFDKLDELLSLVGVGERFKRGHLVAIKLHFGEKGNTSFIQPVFVRRVVDAVKKTGARPFLTDTNTLYTGTRANSVDHLQTAVENGFAYAVVAAPLIIADGLRGNDGVEVKVDGRHFKEVSIAREIASASGIVALTHFKCHEMSGFGGSLKNIGMGCASRKGKLAQHSNSAPVVDPDGCVACGECALVCPANAIEIGAKAVIDANICIGCGHCIPACPEGTINVRWNETTGHLQEKLAEHAKGALAGKEGLSVFVNFVTRISPACDCYGHNDAPIAPDIGILASTDPVAIDQASADLVNAGSGYPENTALKSGHAPGGDKFRGVYPEVDWQIQLRAAEAMGLGQRQYKLEKI